MIKRLVVSGALLGTSPLAIANDIDSGDTAWMLTATALVLFMTVPGLSLFYAGMVRSKNVLSMFMQCFAIAALVSILWALYGYSLAFGQGSMLIGDLSKVFLKDLTVDSMNGTIPESVHMLYQMSFAVITPALIVGAFAERMKFSAMLVFMALWFTLCYLPVAHWVWGHGWLDALGVLDFSGGTVVHINAGVAGLCAALVLGPRRGYLSSPMPPNNLAYTVVGAGMLWIGWFRIQCGVGSRRGRRGGHGNGGDAVLDSLCRAHVDVLRVGSSRQAERPRHRLGGHRRTRGDYPGLRIGRTDGRPADRRLFRRGVLLRLDRGQGRNAL